MSLSKIKAQDFFLLNKSLLAYPPFLHLPNRAGLLNAVSSQRNPKSTNQHKWGCILISWRKLCIIKQKFFAAVLLKPMAIISDPFPKLTQKYNKHLQPKILGNHHYSFRRTAVTQHKQDAYILCDLSWVGFIPPISSCTSNKECCKIASLKKKKSRKLTWW